MKVSKWLIAVLVVAMFAVFALGSGESETADQGSGSANTKATVASEIGKYSVVIDSCRLAEAYDGKPVVIVKYIFTNVADENPTSFMVAFDDAVFQEGVGLNPAYILDDSANYSSDNQMKEIKKGASLEVEVAYELNDQEKEIEVEVMELFSFNDKKLTKTFSIAK